MRPEGAIALILSVIALVFALSGIVLPSSTDSGASNFTIKTNRYHFPFWSSNLIWGLVDLSIDRLYAVPFMFPRDMQVTKVGIVVYTDNMEMMDNHVRIGWYNDTNLYPHSLIEQTEVAILWGNPPVELTFSTPQNCSGVYWAVICIDDDGYEMIDILATRLHYARGHTALGGFSSIPYNTGNYADPPVYYKDYTYGSLPSTFPSGATQDKNYILAFCVYVTEML